MKNKSITFCIPSKNNLRYLKNSIRSIKQNSAQEHDIIVYVDSDNDGTESWLIENGVTYIKNESKTPKGIAYSYNRCIEAAKTDIVCTFHADMFMAKDFDTNIIKHLKSNTVVCATRIEPPLHPVGKEKIIMDFGMYPEDFAEDLFNSFVEERKIIDKDKITNGIFAPWACYKDSLIRLVGLHDEDFHSYHEDSDIFNRMLLSGMKCVQSRDSFVYHLTCRGGQFQDGIEKITEDRDFHRMKSNAAKHYIRKWGSWMKNDEYQHPILTPKYNVAFVVNNCTSQLLEVLEPWCDRIYINNDKLDYTDWEQKNTKFDLKKRVLTVEANNPIAENDVVIQFNANDLNQNSFQLIQQLPEILKDSGDIGQFELDIFKITINSLETYENHLIGLNDEYYKSKLVKI